MPKIVLNQWGESDIIKSKAAAKVKDQAKTNMKGAEILVFRTVMLALPLRSCLKELRTIQPPKTPTTKKRMTCRRMKKGMLKQAFLAVRIASWATTSGRVHS